MTARVTVITTSRPATLSKRAQLSRDGSLVRSGGGVLVEGNAEIIEVSSLLSSRHCCSVSPQRRP